MYFGNNAGVLEYDGKSWRQISMPNQTNARSLAVDSAGRVYVGAQNELGYLAPDSSGKLCYQSLMEYLSEEDQNSFTDVWKTHASAEGIWFQSKERLFYWSNGTFQTYLPTNLDPENPNSDNYATIRTSFLLGGILYIKETNEPLKKIVDGKLVMVGDSLLAPNRVYSMLPHGENEILVTTRKEGFFLLDASEELRKLPSTLESYFSDDRVYSGTQINQNAYIFTTLKNGCVIVDKDGRELRRFDENYGLPELNIKAAFVDRQNKLWLATQNGIFRIDYESPITHFGLMEGLAGTVLHTEIFNGRVFAATALGVYYSDSSGRNFMPTGIQQEAWHLSKFKSDDEELLIVVLGARIYALDKDMNQQEVIAAGAWSTLQTSAHPECLTVALEDGLMMIPYKNNSWGTGYRIKGIESELHNMCEDDDGNLWIGSMRDGIFKVSISPTDTTVTQYDTTAGIPTGFTFPYFWNDKIVIGSNEGLFEYDEQKDIVRPEQSFSTDPARGFGAFHRLSSDPLGRLWVVYEDQREQMYIGHQSTLEPYIWEATKFAKVSEGMVHTFLHNENGITLLGGSEGLYRYDAKGAKEYTFPYPTLIRKVQSGRDSMLFDGSMYNENGYVVGAQPTSLIPTFSYTDNSLKIFFSNCYFEYEDQLEYSYILDGNDQRWSEWDGDNKANYTNLHEGSYTFKVKARNIYGEESEMATYAFNILPPWYRTWWAYILYALGFVTFVYGAVTFSTRRLKEMVRRATQEIVEQKEQIEQQKKLVEDKNKDITDSIEYASTIQSAILPSKEKLSEFMPDHFIMFKPRDIVSGDFYWINHLSNDKIVIIAADCTGHGVPGAFMSMIGNSLLNEIIIENGIDEADEILNRLKAGIMKALSQKSNDAQSKDGMDIALAVLDRKNNKLDYAGANNSLYIVKPKSEDELAAQPEIPEPAKEGERRRISSDVDNETHILREIKPDKQPIGYHTDKIEPFTKHSIQLEKGDTFYLFTDGYADQFGGPKGKKFKYKPFKRLLLSLYEKNMAEQQAEMEQVLGDWMADYEQIDDICIVGFRV